MRAARVVAAALAVVLALVLQVSVLPETSWRGAVPDLLLLLVVAAGLTRGETFAMVLGFAAGLALDLAPPADHTAGRWALALVLVGYVAGSVRPDDAAPRPVLSSAGTWATVAACSLLGTSAFALTGLLLSDLALDVTSLLQVVLASLALDLLATPLVLPASLWILDADAERVPA